MTTTTRNVRRTARALVLLVAMCVVTSPAHAQSFQLLAPTPGLAGMDNTLTARFVTPGERVYFVYSLLTGSTPVPGCRGVFVNMASPKVLGIGIGDDVDEAHITRFVPDAGQGRTVRLQAVEPGTCRVSNWIDQTF